jgi:hypothetical protein
MSLARPAERNLASRRKSWRRGLAELLVLGSEVADDRKQFDHRGARIGGQALLASLSKLPGKQAEILARSVALRNKQHLGTAFSKARSASG